MPNKKQTSLIPLIFVVTIAVVVVACIDWTQRCNKLAVQRRHLQDCTNHIAGLTVMVAKEKAHADNAEAVLALCEGLRIDEQKQAADQLRLALDSITNRTHSSAFEVRYVMVTNVTGMPELNSAKPAPRFWPVPIKLLHSPRASELLRVVRTNVVVW